MKPLGQIIVLLFLLRWSPCAGVHVDTLKSTSEIKDAVIYSFEGCVAEVSGEDCRRYNAGGIPNLYAGLSGQGRERRSLLRFPGWDGSIPDSAELYLYCWYEYDNVDRRIFAYPVTRRFHAGTEAMYNAGDYPDPDSGVTWYHAWLDVGDTDSLNWTSPGGDYTTAVACTMIVTGTEQYFVVPRFERLLAYFDSTGLDPAIILINENAFPGNYSEKLFKSTEYSVNNPLLLLYTTVPDDARRRRRRLQSYIQSR